MKKKLLILFLTLILAAFATSCSLFGSDSNDDSVSENAAGEEINTQQFLDENGNVIEEIDPETGMTILPEGNGIIFDEEGEGVQIQPKKVIPSQFIGTWEATSDQAAYLYGNFDLVVAANNTWSADITGDKYVGKWTESEDGLRMTGDRFSFDLVFDQGGKLIMIEHVDGTDQELHTVLTKK